VLPDGIYAPLLLKWQLSSPQLAQLARMLEADFTSLNNLEEAVATAQSVKLHVALELVRHSAKQIKI
jgi:hypothetical protein